MLCIDGPVFTFGPMIERECTSKRRYSSPAEADREAEIIFNEGGPVLYVYQCSFCYGYHFSRVSRSE